GYILLLDASTMPQIRTSLFIKTPTASVSDGLGTGEFDFGGGFDLSKWFGDLHLAGEVLYNYQGRVSGFDLNNYVSYSGMVGYQITESIRPMLVLKGATAPSAYSEDLLEARARVIWSLTDKTSLDMYGSRGITDSSPDYGGGISVIYSF
ncbi:MAG: transporter, partial [Deltaproteobacteria bacterium]